METNSPSHSQFTYFPRSIVLDMALYEGDVENKKGAPDPDLEQLREALQRKEAQLKASQAQLKASQAQLKASEVLAEERLARLTLFEK